MAILKLAISIAFLFILSGMVFADKNNSFENRLQKLENSVKSDSQDNRITVLEHRMETEVTSLTATYQNSISTVNIVLTAVLGVFTVITVFFAVLGLSNTSQLHKTQTEAKEIYKEVRKKKERIEQMETNLSQLQNKYKSLIEIVLSEQKLDLAKIDGDSFDKPINDRISEKAIFVYQNSLLHSAKERYLYSAAEFGRKNYKSVKEVLQGLINEFPNEAKYHNSYGLTLLKLKQFEQADEHFRLALNLDPDNWQYAMNLSNTKKLAGKPKESIELISNHKLLEKSAEDPRVYLNLAVAMIDLGQVEDALAMLNNAETRSKEGKTDCIANIEFNRACIYAIERNKDEAEKKLFIAWQYDKSIEELAYEDRHLRTIFTRDELKNVFSPKPV